jgi:hypothetical protein
MNKKTIELKRLKEDFFPEKMSLDLMREIWNDKDNEFSDKQLLRLRDFAYLIMETVIKIAKRKKGSTIIELKPKQDEIKESNTLHPGEYRRAG